MACVMAMRPVTLMANMVVMSSGLILGALSVPRTMPLGGCWTERLHGRGWAGESALRVVDEHVDVLEIRGQLAHESLDLLRRTDVQLDGQDLDAITDLRLDLLGQLLQSFESAGSHNELEIFGRGAGKLQGGRLAYNMISS